MLSPRNPSDLELGKLYSTVQLVDFQGFGQEGIGTHRRFRTVVDDLSAEFHSNYVHPQATNCAQIRYPKIRPRCSVEPFDLELQFPGLVTSRRIPAIRATEV